MQTSNPAIQYGKLDEAFRDSPNRRGGAGVMTMDGAMGKTALLLLVTAGAAAFAWHECARQLVSSHLAGSTAMVAMQGMQKTATVRSLPVHW
jgi:uncharacterized YccA/Bax inhibitor family protein